MSAAAVPRELDVLDYCLLLFFHFCWGGILHTSGFWYFTFGLSLSKRAFRNVSNSSFERFFSGIFSLLNSESGQFIYCLFQTMKYVKKEITYFNMDSCVQRDVQLDFFSGWLFLSGQFCFRFLCFLRFRLLALFCLCVSFCFCRMCKDTSLLCFSFFHRSF